MSHPGLLFDPSGTRTEARVARESWSTPGALGPRASSLGQLFDTAAPSKVQSLPGCLSKPWALGHGPDSTERQVNPADPPTRSQIFHEVGRHRRHSDPGPSLPGMLVKPEGHRTKDRVACDNGRPRGTTEQSASRLGQLVDPVGPWKQARVARDSWSTPRALGHRRKFPWRCGRSCGPSHPSAIHPGELVKTVGPRNRSRVAWESWWTP